MIIEGLITTCGTDGKPHAAPMGPVVNEELDQWTLRPFQTSSTFQNLRAHEYCVFHVLDDVLPLTQLVLRQTASLTFDEIRVSATEPCKAWLAREACQWFLLRITHWNIENDRSEARAELCDQGQLRPFWGWNRAKHAVLEAAILTTRLHFLDLDEVEREFAGLASAVEKTAGEQEQKAWQLLVENLAAAKKARTHA